MIPLRDVIPSRTTPGVTVTLIAVNVAVYLFQLMLTDRGQDAFILGFGLVPAYFSPISVVTAMFVHSGLAHLGGNMLFLWIFGDNVEDRLGHGRFIVFYLACGFAAAFAQTALNPESLVPMVGASGAIAGVMGAYFVLYPQSRVLTLIFLFIFVDIVEIPAIFFLGIWFLMQLLSGVGSLGVSHSAAGGVAFWAHIGGFVAGLLIGIVLRSRGDRRWAHHPGWTE
jgi:membrane associated rhomboid family serine protease